MMMIPKKKNEFDLFEDMFRDPFQDSFFSTREMKLMKTDIKEKDAEYVVEMDLPGYDKENIELEIENGYLKVTAKISKDSSNDENKEDKYIHRERFYGECSRSFYIGNNITEEDIKASFKNGILTVSIPKEEKKKIENKKLIQID